MTYSHAELVALLHRLDDPVFVERPRGYDHAATRAVFEQLVARLDAAFDTRCRVDRQVQDASLHARVEVPGEATTCQEQIVVSVSNFGSMAVVAAENPGVYDDTDEAVEAAVLDADDLRSIERALADLGYVLIPERLLTRPYDGVSPLATYRPAEPRPDWWIRYFDYI
ncbi:hypothetical protein [Streptomyces gibsoniae]|uniref:Uncharacterized protein n=1 Tax=Streptomyces gibsoniae TaxID=3075529 RepID=A0ABU2TQJ6_9ACTN|nr:hypothetical protein [Streptomyces sp. DSM 41699]MDT0463210.1 hypothetical protein [Streptomyces sp. DSM 41699]